MGLGFSADRGETWVNSLVPGYPQDTSAEGMASPLFGSHTDAGDPVAAFDRAGNLYAGGIAFNRVKPANGDVWVAKYLPPRIPAATPTTTPTPGSSVRAALGRAGRHLPGQDHAGGRPHRRRP